MSDQLLLLLAPLAFSSVLALVGAVARAVDPRQMRRRRLQAVFEATKDRPTSRTHQTADVLWAAYLRQEAASADTHRAAGWARNSNVMSLFAGALLIATFAVGIADPAGDLGETILTVNLVRMFESSALGAAFALALGSALMAIVFALVSWGCNKGDETDRIRITEEIDALSAPGSPQDDAAATSASERASAGPAVEEHGERPAETA